MNYFKKIQTSPITYKILIDIFFVMTVFTFLFLLAESIIPGILSAKISTFFLFSLMFLLITTVSLISRKQNTFAKTKQLNTFLLIIALIVFVLLITLSCISYGLIYGIIIAALSILTFLLLHSELTEYFK